MARKRRGIFHIRHGQPYHRENSLRGIARAARAGYKRIDLDLQMTKDGTVVCTHWPRPLLRDGFRDPQHKISRFAKVSSLTWAEVQRLHTRDGYHIRSLDICLAACASHGIDAVLEPKGDPRFRDANVWRNIRAMAQRHKVHVTGYTLRRNAGAIPYMRAAGIAAHPLKH